MGLAALDPPERGGLRTQRFHPAAHERSNKGMNATRISAALKLNHPGGRVIPGVRSPDRSGLIAQEAQAASPGRPNNCMHATAHTKSLMIVAQGGA